MAGIGIACAGRASFAGIVFLIAPAFAASPSRAPATPAPCPAGATCLDPQPLLRIETGMHLSMINRVGVDAACRFAVTGSDDKTARVWRMPDGHPMLVERLQSGRGDDGQVNAVAVAPDGTHIALGVQDGGILLLDTANDARIRRIGRGDERAFDLAVSPDGRRIAAALANGDGVRLFDLESGAQLAADDDYASESYGVAFARDGAFYATGFDGRLRRYDPNGRRTASVPTPGGPHAYAVAVSPDGRRVAVGYDDASAVDLFDARTLRHIAKADTKGLDGRQLSYVAWSQDGRLFAGGTYQVGDDNKRALRVFDPEGRRVGADVPIADNTITGIAACGDAMLVVSAAPAISLLRANGTTIPLAEGRKIDVRGKRGRAFMISDDATKVRFGLGAAADDPVLFDLAAGTLTAAPRPPPGFLVADATSLPLADWKNETHPTLAGAPLRLHDEEVSRSVAIRPDHKGFVLGADWSVNAFDAAGHRLWRVPMPATAWGVNVSRDGALVVVANSDGTIRWLRSSDGQTLLSLFVDAKDRRFVAWTQSGYYFASPGAEDLIGWQINRGWTRPATFIPGSRLRDRFERPDIVRLVLETGDEADAIRRAAAGPVQTPWEK